jgi:acyl-CoA dehydrogenase family protein 9
VAWVADRELRRYGKEIIGKQFVSRRIADVLTDLFVTACVLSRVTASLEKRGEKGAARELEIARVFSRAARSRIRGNLHRVDSNDDALVTALADDALEREAYGWDLLTA